MKEMIFGYKFEWTGKKYWKIWGYFLSLSPFLEIFETFFIAISLWKCCQIQTGIFGRMGTPRNLRQRTRIK